MDTANAPTLLQRLARSSDLVIPFMLVLSVVMLIVPLPAGLIDFFVALSLSLSLMTILVAMNVLRPLEFSVFPTWILMITLFRLSLNVSTTRSILINPQDAPDMVRTFGQWVVGGDVIVGIVIFAILVVVNYIVIANGAQRIGEVAARFTLDAMPGKQMAIDAELTNGLIDEKEARQRRKDVGREADYYGAMDGASRFIKGEAIAGIVITLINIAAGFIMGMVRHGMSAGQAFETYTQLTVGDGLVSQLPALMMSVATGLLVTNAAGDMNIGASLMQQLGRQPTAILVSGGLLAMIGLLPGMPKLFMWPLAAALIFAGRQLGQQVAQVRVAEEARQAAELQEGRPGEGGAASAAAAPEPGSPEAIMELLAVDTLELELGYSLIPLVDAQQEGDLLSRIRNLRRQLALELGIVIPAIRIRDNIQLKPQEYIIRLRGSGITRYELQVDRLLAIQTGEADSNLGGTPTTDPAFGLPARWIAEGQRGQAELAGYTVVDPTSVLTTHLTETIRSRAGELLDREAVKGLLDKLRERQPVVVNELVPQVLGLGDIQRVLRRLLLEGVSIRDLGTILEALADAAPLSKDLDYLVEQVRLALARQITQSLDNGDGVVRVFTTSLEVEEAIQAQMQASMGTGGRPLAPATLDAMLTAFRQCAERAQELGVRPVLVCYPRSRTFLRRLVEKEFPRTAVISYAEVTPDVRMEAIGMLEVAQLHAV
ncbi:MAG: Flagellar biosynthesis protein FlhA [bacterium]|nr:Flagellar biosynthesis protein FlhA [bacterium]